ncbi:hypothetical protein C1S70_20795 (plasmid) [Azospirillum argentinense]|uniref:Uncharacterized protein n=1 Tax=Azospirillum argentinense TaxID=2970906 RepID=A0A2K1FWJ1_9PROT|nr:hypothetical protein C1S70_20795 [Azospirillum argentinense]
MAWPPLWPTSPTRACARWRDGQGIWRRAVLNSPLPSGERVARRAGEGDAHGGTSSKSATPSP